MYGCGAHARRLASEACRFAMKVSCAHSHHFLVWHHSITQSDPGAIRGSADNSQIEIQLVFHTGKLHTLCGRRYGVVFHTQNVTHVSGFATGHFHHAVCCLV